MSDPQITDLEGRVKRLEEWANRPDWLDEPATINGEPVYLSKTFPWPAKLMFAVILASIIGLFLLIMLGLCGI